MPDRYQEITPIGKYKNIWLVLDRDTGKIYVKKCLETFNQKVYERVAGLHSIHIPGIAAWKMEEGKFWLIEEYINGETLEERLNRGHSFTREEAVGIVRQVCEALACLHSQEPPVIHRDVKLSNIMISQDGIVKLIDYNAARLYEKGLNQDTRLIGTEAYAAPEQFGFAQTDARTDIYSLGVVFNYLLTGVHIKDRMAEGACGVIIRKCTQMDPRQRYQSVWELDQALQALQMNGAAEAGVAAKETVAAKEKAEAGAAARDAAAKETAEAADAAGMSKITGKAESPIHAGPASAPWAEKDAGLHEEDRYRERRGETDRRQEDEYVKNGPTGKPGIWPIPGFRSGVWWKKMLAVMGYLFIIYLSLTVKFEVDAGRPLALWSDRILLLVSLLFAVAVYTDYHGAAAKMPLLRNKKKEIRWLGYYIVWPFTYGILLLLKEMVVLLFQTIVKI